MADGDGGVNARLVVALEARLERFEKAMTRAKLITNETSGSIEQRIKEGEKTLEKYGDGFGKKFAKELETAGSAANLTRNQMLELAHVTRSVVDGLASGASPVRLFAQESGRLGEALKSGPGGVAGSLGAIAGMLNPVVAGVVALVAVMGAGVLAANDYAKAHNQLLGLFQGLARGARVSIADVEALAEANAKAGHATVGASEQFVQAFVHINGMTRENLGEAIAVVNDFAKATGRDSKESLAALTKALDDPKSGIIDLNRQVSAFTQEEIRQVQALADHGDRAAALKIILDRLNETVGGSAEHLTGLGKVLKTVGEGFSVAWREAGKFFDRLVHGPSDEDQLKELQDRLSLGKNAGTFQDRAELQRQIDAIKARIAASPKAKGEAAAAKERDDQEAADRLGITNGGARTRKGLNAQLAELQGYLKGPNPHGFTQEELTEQIGEVKRKLERLDRKEDIKKPTKIADTTGAFDRSTTDALDKATVEQLQAQEKLTEDIRERAAAEKRAINAAADKERDDLDAKRREIEAAPGDKNKAAQLARLQLADAAIDAAQKAKEDAVDRQLKEELEKADLARTQQITDANKQLLSAQLAIADTRSQRRSIELKLLQIEKDELDAKLKQQREDALKKDPANAKNINAGFDVLQGTSDQLFGARTIAANRGTASPWEQWAEEGKKASLEVGDALERAAVKGMDQFNAGVAEAIVNGKNMRQVFTQIFKEMEADLVRYLLKQAEIGVFGGGSGGTSSILSTVFKLPGFAEGTNFAPGGAAIVGENGPEVVNLPRGSQVLPNNLLGSLSSLGNSRASVSTVIQGPSFNLSGAVVTQDLLDQMHAISRNHSAQAAAAAVQTARSVIPADMQRRSMARLR